MTKQDSDQFETWVTSQESRVRFASKSNGKAKGHIPQISPAPSGKCPSETILSYSFIFLQFFGEWKWLNQYLGKLSKLWTFFCWIVDRAQCVFPSMANLVVSVTISISTSQVVFDSTERGKFHDIETWCAVYHEPLRLMRVVKQTAS